MIINSVGSTKYTIGDTKEYKTTIDVENLDFIASLLSSNLYSDPEASFIREIVSNGWDSHVEAGNTDTPILVKVSRSNGSYYSYDITIRDYGTGLSKEDFENIYCKIGTSTKRLSNNYLGCFGIGKFSTMAVSKVAYITSYFDGVARFYIMTKDGNEITTNLMSETPTTEHNGLEVTVKNVGNIDRYKRAINALIFFPNVYVDGITTEVNDAKIKKFKYFSACTNRVNDKILLGNVLYPLNTSAIPSELYSLYKSIELAGIVINFNIGELSVTPNRESIIYNSKTNTLIAERLKQAFDEMKEIMKKVMKLDCDDPHKYYTLLNRSFGFDFVYNTDYYNYSNPSYAPTFKIKDLDFKISLQGNKDINETVLLWINYHNPCLKAYVTSDKVYKDKYPYAVQRSSNSPTSNIIFVHPDLKFTSVLKNYLSKNYPNTVVVSNITFDDFKLAFYDNYTNIDLTNPVVLKTLQICYNHYISRGKYIDFDNCQDFINYKEQVKKEAKENKVPSFKEIILYVNRPGHLESKRYFKKYDEAIAYIKSLNNGIFFRKLDETYEGGLANKLGYITISANQSVLKALDKEKFTSRIDKEILQNNKRLIFARSAQLSNIRHISLYHLMNKGFYETLPADLQKLVCELKSAESFLYHSVEVPIDQNIVDKLNQIASYYNKYKDLITELGVEGDANIRDLVSYIIMKNKIYRINSACYKKIKSNKIILRLCKK